LIDSFARLLTSEQVEQVHEASLEILENVGVLVRNEEARELYIKHGGENAAFSKTLTN
jgi:trimethylamine--corrinoid protein Co-methyltransferase